MSVNRRKLFLALFLVAAIAATVAFRVWTAHLSADRNLEAALADPDMPRIVRTIEPVESFHEPKRPPGPGDWLASHEESGQTFHEYLSQRPTRVVDRFSTLYVQPLGSMTERQTNLARQTADTLAAFYGLPVKTLDPLPLDDLPDSAQRINGGELQYLTGHLLDRVLAPRVPDDAAAVLGLTATDLWAGEGWNYVFGEASLDGRVGVWSIARFGDPDESDVAYRRCLRRTLGVALHETGHMLGILHCTAYECGMNGANSLRESDAQPLDFCPECTAKVLWACRAESRKRYERLADLIRSYGLEQEGAALADDSGQVDRQSVADNPANRNARRASYLHSEVSLDK